MVAGVTRTSPRSVSEDLAEDVGPVEPAGGRLGADDDRGLRERLGRPRGARDDRRLDDVGDRRSAGPRIDQVMAGPPVAGPAVDRRSRRSRPRSGRPVRRRGRGAARPATRRAHAGRPRRSPTPRRRRSAPRCRRPRRRRPSGRAGDRAPDRPASPSRRRRDRSEARPGDRPWRRARGGSATSDGRPGRAGPSSGAAPCLGEQPRIEQPDVDDAVAEHLGAAPPVEDGGQGRPDVGPAQPARRSDATARTPDRSGSVGRPRRRSWPASGRPLERRPSGVCAPDGRAWTLTRPPIRSAPAETHVRPRLVLGRRACGQPWSWLARLAGRGHDHDPWRGLRVPPRQPPGAVPSGPA